MRRLFCKWNIIFSHTSGLIFGCSFIICSFRMLWYSVIFRRISAHSFPYISFLVFIFSPFQSIKKSARKSNALSIVLEIHYRKSVDANLYIVFFLYLRKTFISIKHLSLLHLFFSGFQFRINIFYLNIYAVQILFGNSEFF